jgi:hypothetical protein
VAAFATWSEWRGRGSLGALPAGHAFVSFLVAEDAVLGWAASASGLQPFRADSRVHALAARFAAMCATPDAPPAAISALRDELAEALLGPARPVLAGATQWTIDADRWLHALPFEALGAPENTVTYAASPVAPAAFGSLSGRASILIAPRAVTPDGRALPFLEPAVREGAEIERLFPGAHRLDPEKVQLDAPDTAIFHFAGHGWTQGGYGGLLLPPGADGAPRFLTAADFAAVRYPRGRLAVLAGCLTTGGGSREPESPGSLVQALFGAGMPNIVATRWNVDGEVSRILVERFYGGLSREGVGPALASARAAVRARHPHPYYWAGFSHFAKGVPVEKTSL